MTESSDVMVEAPIARASAVAVQEVVVETIEYVQVAMNPRVLVLRAHRRYTGTSSIRGPTSNIAAVVGAGSSYPALAMFGGR